MKRAIFVAFLVALAFVLFTNRSEAIFGADSSGYANLARMLDAGETTRPVPLACEGCDPRWFTPLGFVVVPERRLPVLTVGGWQLAVGGRPPPDHAMRPGFPANRQPPTANRGSRRSAFMASFYPLGLPLHLALAARIGGWERAPFFVSPLAGLLLVALTYWLGRRLHSELAGLIAAVLMGLCAVFVFQALQPMSDVLVAMWSAAAIAAAVEGRQRPAFSFLAGLCFGIAVLVRPTSALLLLPLAFALGGVKPALRFGVGGVPAALILAWYNLETFHSLLMAGYEAIGLHRGFALSYFPSRAMHYLRWTVQQFSPIAILAAIGGLAIVPRRDRILLALWFAAFFLFYSFYFWYDTWWYTRFLLPAYPALAVAAGIGFARLFAVPRLRIAAMMVVVLAAAWQIRQNARVSVLYTDEDQHRARMPAEWLARALPPRSLVLSMEYSGALVYYTTHRPIRWDVAPPDRAVAFARASGVPTYALLMQHEEEPFLAKYGSSFRRVRSFEGGTLFAMNPDQPRTEYNPRRMADRTERTFAPDACEPSRRRFMIAGEHVILRAFERDDAERCVPQETGV